jgi:hypothetical protein
VLQILGNLKNGDPVGQIRSIDGRFVILLDASGRAGNGTLNIESRNPDIGESMSISPDNLFITDIDGQLLFSITAEQDSLGNDIVLVLGQVDAGAVNSFSLESNPFWARLINTFKDAVDGDVITLLQSEEATGTISVKKGADNEIIGTVSAAAVVLTVKNVSSDTTIKPESVVTPRLGVGGAAPATDGYASVSDFLGVGASTPSAAEAVKIVGDTNMVGALDVSGAVTNPLLTSTYVIALPGGTLSSQDAATTRTGLDVYSKSEVDAAIAAAIAAIVVDNALVGTPEEHSHSLS